MFVPVVNQGGQPLMPTTPSRARRWIKTGWATPFFHKGLFCVRLNDEPSDTHLQPVCLGIDPGSKREGYSVVSVAHTYLNVQSRTVDWVKEAEKTQRTLRRSRRGRKTPCRFPRYNPHRGGLPPSTKARWQLKLRVARWLLAVYPITSFAVEDIAVRTKQGQRRWNRSFSPLEVGKAWCYEELRGLGPLALRQGYETKEMRDQQGLSKAKKKLAETWEAHCVDAWVLAHEQTGGADRPDNRQLLCITPMQWHRRMLHRQQPAKGGIRSPYGGTRSCGVKRGTLVTHPRYGLATVGGTREGRISLHDPPSGKRLTQTADPAACRIRTELKWRVRLLPVPSTGRISAAWTAL
jgi:RRXRR protein